MAKIHGKAPKLSAREIQGLGFEWPKYALIQEYCVLEAGKVDLGSTIRRMQASRDYYGKQLAEAFAFKMRHSVDYSDFTARHDDDARIEHELGGAIRYLEDILEAEGQ